MPTWRKVSHWESRNAIEFHLGFWRVCKVILMKITDLKVICTAPDGIRLVVVKVETDSGITGLGCATFTQFPLTVVTAIDNYLKPLILGRKVDEINDTWQAMYLSGYWRNGPVLNNAIAGIDQALWDIKGKVLGVPAFQLFGGKVRNSLSTYVHVNGVDAKEIGTKIISLQERGFKNFRIQFAIPKMSSYGAGSSIPTKLGIQPTQDYRLSLRQEPWEEKRYAEYVVPQLKDLRSHFPKIGIIHDLHERLSPELALEFAKSAEELKLFFLEDPVSPENMDFLENFRGISTPIAFGELLNVWTDFSRVIKERWVSYIRCHLTQLGGVTPALKLAHLAEGFGIKTALHGPGDVSPVGHAAHLHLGLATENFGIQEVYLHGENSERVFKGIPEIEEGLLVPNHRPGFGIEIDEEEAKKFPFPEHPLNGAWPEIRRPDGSIIRP